MIASPYRPVPLPLPTRRVSWLRRVWWRWWGEPLVWTQPDPETWTARRGVFTFTVGDYPDRHCAQLWIHHATRQVGWHVQWSDSRWRWARVGALQLHAREWLRLREEWGPNEHGEWP